MEPAKHIVDLLGGVEAAAQDLKVHRTRVYGWMRSPSQKGTGGIIPQRHFAKILEIAAERGLDITAESLIGVSKSSEAA